MSLSCLSFSVYRGAMSHAAPVLLRVNREAVPVQASIITIVKCGVKPSHFKAPEDVSAACCSVPILS